MRREEEVEMGREQVREGGRHERGKECRRGRESRREGRMRGGEKEAKGTREGPAQNIKQESPATKTTQTGA